MMNEPLLPARVYTSISSSEPLVEPCKTSSDLDLSFLARFRICCSLLGLLVGAFTQLSDIGGHILKLLLPLATNKELVHGRLYFDAIWSLVSSATVVIFLLLLRGVCVSSLKQIDSRKKLSLKWVFEMDVWYGIGAIAGLCLAFYSIRGATMIPIYMWLLGPLLSSVMFGGVMILVDRCIGLERDDEEEEDDDDDDECTNQMKRPTAAQADYALVVV